MRRRRRKVGKHISLSATDADWEIVRRNAKRRGLSIARYLVELVERDASEEEAGLRHECPALALAAEEQREQLEAVREIRALMLEGEDAGPRHECLRHEWPLVRDMQERIAVMFAAVGVRDGRIGPLGRAACGTRLGGGEDRARIAMDSLAVSTAVSIDAPAAKPAKVSQAGAGKTDSRQGRLL